MPLLTSGYWFFEKAGGKPVELYTFARGNSVWRYTSAGRDVTVSGVVFLAAKIQRSELQRKDESGASTCTVQLGRKMAIVAALRDGSTGLMKCTLHKYHPDTSTNPVIQIQGDITNLSIDGSMASFDITSSEAMLDQPIPRILLTPQCAWRTYGADCGVNAEDFKFDTTVTAFGKGFAVVDAWFADADIDTKYYNNGILKIGNNFVYIQQQNAGNLLTIFPDLPKSAVVGDAVTLYAGDDKTFETCRDKFLNNMRFLGFPYLPASNPLLVRAG
jgi:uncharacterized phage protein (TIGR02218 family)